MDEELAGQTQNQKIDWKKPIGLAALLLVAVILGFAWLVTRTREPSYQGEPLSYWLVRAGDGGGIYGDTNNPAFIEGRKAILHIGTNGIPALLRLLKAKDSDLKTKVIDFFESHDFIKLHLSSAEEQNQKARIGFYVLGDLATNAFSELTNIYSRSASPYSREIANFALMQLYPAQCVAIPSWVPSEKRAQWYMEAGAFKSQSGATHSAILAFSQAVILDPTNAEAYLMRGEARIQMQNFSEAMTDLERALEFSPSNQMAFYNRGVCKFSLKDFRGADADFTRAIQFETNDFRFYSSRGLARANLRDLDNAMADFNRAIDIFPREATSYRNRAIVENMQREYELALADVSKSIDLDKRDPTAYALRGRIRSGFKDYETARADFDKAIELNPKDSTFFSSRGGASLYLDDFSSATADLEKALELNPKNPAAFLVRGLLNTKRGGNDDAALADLERAVELAPRAPETSGMLGMFQYKTSDWVSALANCRKSLELGTVGDGSDINCYIWLIRAQSGERDAADRELSDFWQSLPAAKTNEWKAITARFFTGSLQESNFLSLATTSAKRPSAVKAQVCESLYYAGMKRKIAGDKPGALAMFQKCLDTRNDNSIAYMNAGSEMRAPK